jgi:hypothetical protein
MSKSQHSAESDEEGFAAYDTLNRMITAPKAIQAPPQTTPQRQNIFISLALGGQEPRQLVIPLLDTYQVLHMPPSQGLSVYLIVNIERTGNFGNGSLCIS